MSQLNERAARRPAPHVRRDLVVLESRGFPDYQLIDCGRGRKLERFGQIVVDRPEPQALWQPSSPSALWDDAHAVFSGEGEDEAGKWRVQKPVPESWPIRIPASGVAEITLLGRLSAFRHLGLFPEQQPHWQWMVEAIRQVARAGATAPPRVLNLFAYTGAASLLAVQAGAEVVHVDASRKAIAWARENQAASKLNDAPVRWILDDARKFVAREVRRGRRYHVILVDPPKFGRGPGGEVWDLFEHLPALMRDCAALLDQDQARLILTAYAIRASALSIGQLMAETLGSRRGQIESGELAIREGTGTRAISTSLYSRWSSDDLAR